MNFPSLEILKRTKNHLIYSQIEISWGSGSFQDSIILMYVHPHVNWGFELLVSIGVQEQIGGILYTAFIIMTQFSEDYYYTAVDCYS